MLTLPIKKKWFDMIVSGEKKEEYREIKPYYDSRFMNAFGFLLAGGQDGIWRGGTGRNPEAVAGTSSIQKWVLERFTGSCLQMHPAIWKR